MSSTSPPLVPPVLPSPLAPSTESIRLDESLYEVVGGRIVEQLPIGAYQTNVALNILYHLSNFVRPRKLGRAVAEMLVLLSADENLKRRPDVAFVSFDRWPRSTRVPDAEAWDVVPDLAIEVICPSNTAEGILKKIREYFRAGCERVWVVYPIEEQVYVYRSPTQNAILTRDDELDGETTVPGFRLPIVRLFEDGDE